jgi:hypothetical protein
MRNCRGWSRSDGCDHMRGSCRRRRGRNWGRRLCRNRGRTSPRGPGRRFLIRFFLKGGSFGSGLGIRNLLEVLTNFLRVRLINGAGVRFLFFDTYLREVVKDCLSLDLQVTGQVVDPNLIGVWHRPRRLFLIWPWIGRFRFFHCGFGFRWCRFSGRFFTWLRSGRFNRILRGSLV